MDDQLIRKGFSGVTFSVRNDIRYGIRAIPYYQYDGPTDFLEQVRSQLFKYGVPSSIGQAKLRISGVSNCIVLSDLLEISNEWTNALRTLFLSGKYRTEDGIKELFLKFGRNSQLDYEQVCQIIAQYKEKWMNSALKRIYDKDSPLKLLPSYDNLYKTFNTTETCCQNCSEKGVNIYFLGKYPRKGSIFFLCRACATKL